MMDRIRAHVHSFWGLMTDIETDHRLIDRSEKRPGDWFWKTFSIQCRCGKVFRGRPPETSAGESLKDVMETTPTFEKDRG